MKQDIYSILSYLHREKLSTHMFLNLLTLENYIQLGTIFILKRIFPLYHKNFYNLIT